MTASAMFLRNAGMIKKHLHIVEPLGQQILTSAFTLASGIVLARGMSVSARGQVVILSIFITLAGTILAAGAPEYLLVRGSAVQFTPMAGMALFGLCAIASTVCVLAAKFSDVFALSFLLSVVLWLSVINMAYVARVQLCRGLRFVLFVRTIYAVCVSLGALFFYLFLSHLPIWAVLAVWSFAEIASVGLARAFCRNRAVAEDSWGFHPHVLAAQTSANLVDRGLNVATASLGGSALVGAVTVIGNATGLAVLPAQTFSSQILQAEDHEHRSRQRAIVVAGTAVLCISIAITFIVPVMADTLFGPQYSFLKADAAIIGLSAFALGVWRISNLQLRANKRPLAGLVVDAIAILSAIVFLLLNEGRLSFVESPKLVLAYSLAGALSSIVTFIALRKRTVDSDHRS